MFVQFEKHLQDCIKEDPEGLWCKWLELHPVLTSDHVEMVAKKMLSVYFRFMVLAWLSPKPNIAQYAGWPQFEWKNKNDLFYIEFVLPQNKSVIEVAARMAQDILSDLQKRSWHELDSHHQKVWMRCESILGASLSLLRFSDPRASTRLHMIEFRTNELVECGRDNPLTDLDLMINIPPRFTFGDTFVDSRWPSALWSFIKQRIEEEQERGVQRGYSVGEQFAASLLEKAKEEWEDETHEEHVLFVAQKMLFVRFCNPRDITDIAGSVSDNETLFHLGRNLIQCEKIEFPICGDAATKQLKRILEATKTLGNDQELKVLRQLLHNAHILTASEEEKSKKEKDLIGRMLKKPRRSR